MKMILQPVKRLFFQFLLLLLCYFTSRCVFTRINIDHFNQLSLGGFLRIAFHAIKFDLSAIITINAPYIILLLLPLRVTAKPWWNKMLQWLFILTNAYALGFECSDWVYYTYTLKRSTADVFHMIGGKGDFWQLLPHFLITFWYVPLFYAGIITIIAIVNKKITKDFPIRDAKQDIVLFLKKFAVLAVVAGLSILGYRGGLPVMPINNGTALQVTSNEYVPVLLNTPFSIIHSFTHNELDELHYYTDEELVKYFDPIKQYTGKSFQKKNVVIIILESFSKEHTSLGVKSYTPFLDSLMSVGFVCRQAYANALHSAEGIPAVVAGLPSLMDEPFPISMYGTNHVTAFPGLLKKEGYATAFFHGGSNGTMNFDEFGSNAGYDKYYGRNEYDNDKDYDGNWGIWDEPYLQYFANAMSKMKQPFCTTVFTLSSHDPFKVPEQYKDVLPKGNLPLMQSMAYTDMSLRKFFATAAKQPWYNNTVFVLSADHACLLSNDPNYYTDMGVYSIPIVFFAPGDTGLKGSTDTIMQQIDILPSVMDYIGYDKPFFAFGNSIFRTIPKRFTINELENVYQYMMDGYLMKTKKLVTTEFYDFSKPINSQTELMQTHSDTVLKHIEPYFKAFVQLYNNSMIHDKMYVPEKAN